MSDPASEALPGLPPRDVAFRHLASDAWLAAELAARGESRFDRRRPSALFDALAEAWWRAVREDPTPALFRAGRAPAARPVRAEPRPEPPRPAPIPAHGPPMPAASQPKPPPAPPVREARLAGVEPPRPAPPTLAAPRPPAAPAPPAAPVRAAPRPDEPAFLGLPSGVRQLARGLATADRTGAPALKRLVAPHVPTRWSAADDPATHPSWDVLGVACRRHAPPVDPALLAPAWRAVCNALAEVPDAEVQLEHALRWGPVSLDTALALLDGLPLLRGAPTPVARVADTLDALAGKAEGPLGVAHAARAASLAASAPVARAAPAEAPPPSQRWAAHLARMRPGVRALLAGWLDATSFERTAAWSDALAHVRARPEVTRPFATFGDDAWAALADARAVRLAPSERAALAALTDEGQLPALTERLREVLLGGPASDLVASFEAALAALPTDAIDGERDARDPPYGERLRWDGARLVVAWPKHAAWKDPRQPPDAAVRVPFWPASRGASFECPAHVVPRVVERLAEALAGGPSDLLDDLDLARAASDATIDPTRAALGAAYEALQAELVVDGDFAGAARAALAAVTPDALEPG